MSVPAKTKSAARQAWELFPEDPATTQRNSLTESQVWSPLSDWHSGDGDGIHLQWSRPACLEY